MEACRVPGKLIPERMGMCVRRGQEVMQSAAQKSCRLKTRGLTKGSGFNNR